MILLVFPLNLEAYSTEPTKYFSLILAFGFAHITFSYFVSFWFSTSQSALKAFSMIYLLGGFFLPLFLKTSLFYLIPSCDVYQLVELLNQLIPLQPLYIGFDSLMKTKHPKFFAMNDLRTRQQKADFNSTISQSNFTSAQTDTLRKNEELREMYENCKNNFTSTSQSITMLIASGIFWMILVLVIERVKNWRVRKSENERYEIKKREEVEAVEEKING